MTAPHSTSPQELSGRSLYDKDGQKVGSIQQVYLDDASGEPEWVTVRTGMFGTKETFVPLGGAQISPDRLQVPYGKEDIKEAPRIDAGGHLDPAEEENLYRHYDMSASGGRTGRRPEDTAGTPRTAGPARSAGTPAPAGAPAPAARERETARVRGTPEITRSEERAYIDTEQHESGRARLRKHVVTEDVHTTVPVSHEEVRVTREPVGPEERTRSSASPIEEAQVELTLHEERPVVRKETVPVERVRLEAEKVTEEEEVSTKVRKEQVDYDSGRGKGSEETPGQTGRGGSDDRFT
ncbi:DUF2382 domain-containing protein [Streptomyces sp. MNU89]|uniref:DUF2382 domain-containing protein n=1 Tax=Streptomyces sp. MNU89 TaxID=2560025 RepID=UPI001E44160A|nr:PRC and DUF2382 domain-containing protein [Streptomyces sp. MNU89]MCC9742931.1 PRC and DUF2382 domain-containing protein [Streptomyces sp. MNU89]